MAEEKKERRSWAHSFTVDLDELNSEAPDDGCHQGMFVDAAAMKEKLRLNMTKPVYDVCNYYHTTGWCQHVARSGKFENTTLAVIAFNAIWMSIDTDLNTAPMLLQAEPIFQIAEHAFCAYFFWEWCMRFGAFKQKRNGLRDFWFVFDTSLVGLMVMETWVMTTVLLLTGSGGGGGLSNASILRLLRLLRLSRMARMAKLLRSMPELLILVKGMVSAMRSVFFTLLLLMILLYIFGIAFRQLVGDTPAGKLYFSSMINAMHTLLLDGCLLDGAGRIVVALAEESFVYVLVFYVFILLAALTVLNMLIGVLCEVVSAVAATEKEAITVSLVKEGVEEIIQQTGLDRNGDHMISKVEFEAILDNPEAAKLLKRVDVDVYGLVDLSDFIFTRDDGGEKDLSFMEFMDIVLSLRGSNVAMVKDIVDLRKFIKTTVGRLDEKISRTNNILLRRAKQKPSSMGGRVKHMDSTLSNIRDGVGPLDDGHWAEHAGHSDDDEPMNRPKVRSTVFKGGNARDRCFPKGSEPMRSSITSISELTISNGNGDDTDIIKENGHECVVEVHPGMTANGEPCNGCRRDHCMGVGPPIPGLPLSPEMSPTPPSTQPPSLDYLVKAHRSNVAASSPMETARAYSDMVSGAPIPPQAYRLLPNAVKMRALRLEAMLTPVLGELDCMMAVFPEAARLPGDEGCLDSARMSPRHSVRTGASASLEEAAPPTRPNGCPEGSANASDTDSLHKASPEEAQMDERQARQELADLYKRLQTLRQALGSGTSELSKMGGIELVLAAASH
eukprot:TRINITY_DN11218_c0_g1_i1.p1 TRINITY_DN11218_c0_g1~~TRINITY_DN11218_c0_g1_i1.p1  ORF type:complete len:784 (-),score=151.71 TRINITY_DN11218_c0_g1_i1:418-2769(-)